ncbi:MAG TPA: hypothetical protein DDZ51_01250 [Planctomycetaceae bacterium]|nr:hypothetical protein [Planctomycetaceae bacterium]
MKPTLALFAGLLLVQLAELQAAQLRLTSPLDHQVVQRSGPSVGQMRITGELSEELLATDCAIEAQFSGAGDKTPWLRVTGSVVGRTLKGTVEGPAGGWWRLEIRVTHAGKIITSGTVDQVGIGEVFVVAGQSNSANHGEEKQRSQSGRVATFDGKAWRLADDPQPGASGAGGSFIPPFADALVAKLDVPVGIIACGIGATSVREWLPKGVTFANPPTIESRVERLADGSWVSRGNAYEAFVARMKQLGPYGFRAVLWHQGESDANQKDPTRTLPGHLYREFLESIIRDSRKAIGWDAPWFVAQVSYHSPDDEASEDIRAAQASLWRDGIALEGPDSDALKGALRERNGQGVHFSGPGLREHGAKWAEKIAPWLDQRLADAKNYHPSRLPKGRDYFELRLGAENAYRKFELEKRGRIAFLGGSITAGRGWRDHTMKYFETKFPNTKFEFIAAGISSMGSVPHAFRLERDVLSKGPVDLLFVEAAVNDSTNIPDHPEQMLRAMEGLVRHARQANPLMDIVHLHFVMPSHMEDYRRGSVPVSIAQHEKVAAAYNNASLNLSLEVTDRIDAGEFTWDKDFKDLHPSEFGHQLYANSIARMFDIAFALPPAETNKRHTIPAMIDAQCYAQGRLGSLADVKNLQGFSLNAMWKPADQQGTRAGFVDVPALVGTEPGSMFEFNFTGTGCGLFIAAGPDAGYIEFSIDGGEYRQIDTFTNWSERLHLPWALILDDNLNPGLHNVRVRIASDHNARATGTALRVFHLLLN